MNKKIIAVYPVTNTMSINIYDVQHGIEDRVLAGYNDKKPRLYKIYHNTKGSYFNFGKIRVNLAECLRV